MKKNEPLLREACKYAAYYCEENVWWLLQHAQLKPGMRSALFISNVNRTCALWNQGLAAPEQPVVWDYHAVVIVKDELQSWVYDLDSRLDFPVTAAEYVQGTFPHEDINDDYLPQFREVEDRDMIRHFASDRTHMVTEGQFVHPAPSWPLIGTGNNLEHFLDIEASFLGEVLDLPTFKVRHV